MRTWAEIQKERPTWLELFEYLGLDFADHYFPSKRQAKMDSEVRCDAYTRTCQCGSTLLLMVSLVSWGTWARRHQLRERAATMLQLFLVRTVLESSCDHSELQKIFAQAREGCCPEVGGCCHEGAVPIIGASWSASKPPQVQLAALMLEMFRRVRCCQASRSSFVQVLFWVAKLVFDSLPRVVPVASLAKLSPGKSPSGKTKFVEDTYKTYHLRALLAARKGQKAKAHLSLDGFDPSLHMRWVEKGAAAYFTASNRIMHESRGTHGIFEDAARLGNPAREIVIYIGYSAKMRASVAMPPQAPTWLEHCGSRGMGRRRSGLGTPARWRHSAAIHVLPYMWTGRA